MHPKAIFSGKIGKRKIKYAPLNLNFTILRRGEGLNETKLHGHVGKMAS